MHFKQDLCKVIDYRESDLNEVIKLGEALDQVRTKDLKFTLSTAGW